MRAPAVGLMLSAASLGACQLITGIGDYDTGPPGGSQSQGGGGAGGGQGGQGGSGATGGGGSGGSGFDVVGFWSQPAVDGTMGSHSSTLGMANIGDLLFLAGEQDAKTAFKGLASVPPVADGFVVRIRASEGGTADGIAWFLPNDTSSRLHLTAIAAGVANDVIVAGTVEGSYAVNGTEVSSLINAPQTFWMSLDANSLDVNWVRRALGSGTVDAIENGAAGELLIAGASSGRLELGTFGTCLGGVSPTVGGFVARLEGTTGNCLARADITKSSAGDKFAIEDSAIAGNRLTLVGSFQGAITELALNSADVLAGFIAQYDLDLSVPTAVDRSATGDVTISSISAGDAGVAITGTFQGVFGENEAAQTSAFVQILAENFAPELTIAVGNATADQLAGPIDSVLADSDTALIAVTMECQGDIQIGDTLLVDKTPSSHDICFWVMLRTGQVLLADRWGSQLEQSVSGLFVGTDATVIVSGATSSEIQIAPGVVIDPSVTPQAFLMGLGLAPN